MIYHVTVGDRTVEVEVRGSEIRVDGEAIAEVSLVGLGRGPVRSLLVDGQSHRVSARRTGSGTWRLGIGGRAIRAEVLDERTAAIRAMAGPSLASRGPRPVVAPMPGMVVRVEVAEGDRVESGQGVVIVEAMKMENELRTDAAGVVSRVHVAEGQAVEKDEVLVELATPSEKEGS